MKKRLFRILSLLMVCVSCFSMVACDNNENTPTTSPESITSPTDGKNENEMSDNYSAPHSNVCLAAVKTDGKWGYADETGTIVIEPRFDRATEFNSYGIAIVEYEGLMHYIDTTGKILTNENYGPFSTDIDKAINYNGLIPVMDRTNRLYGFMELSGHVAVPLEYSRIEPIYPDANIFKAWKNSKSGILYLDGTFNEVEIYLGPYFQSDFPGYFTIEDKAGYSDFNGTIPVKYGYMDKNGKVIAEPIYDAAYHFTENGLARVRINDHYGYIDVTGKLAIPAQFDDAGDFSDNGLAEVRIGELVCYIDAEANIVDIPSPQATENS